MFEEYFSQQRLIFKTDIFIFGLFLSLCVVLIFARPHSDLQVTRGPAKQSDLVGDVFIPLVLLVLKVRSVAIVRLYHTGPLHFTFNSLIPVWIHDCIHISITGDLCGFIYKLWTHNNGLKAVVCHFLS